MWKLTVISISAPVSLLNCVGRRSPEKLFWVKWGKGRSGARSRHFLKGGNINIGWKVTQMPVDHGRDLRAATFRTTRHKPRLPVLHHTSILEPGKVDSLQILKHLTRLTPRGWCYCTDQDSTYYIVTQQAFNFQMKDPQTETLWRSAGKDWLNDAVATNIQPANTHHIFNPVLSVCQLFTGWWHGLEKCSFPC